MNTGLTLRDCFLKRALDLAIALPGLLLTGWLILLAWVAASIDTRQNGLFKQVRIGRWGRPFTVYKIRTMRASPISSTTTASNDPRITPLGRWLRAFKLDELPQLINVVLGDMSLVGPRPDVPGFADLLEGEDRIILSIRPGITGPATLYYRNEETLLSGQDDKEAYNRNTIYPHKVTINKNYIHNYSFSKDLRILFQTITGL